MRRIKIYFLLSLAILKLIILYSLCQWKTLNNNAKWFFLYFSKPTSANLFPTEIASFVMLGSKFPMANWAIWKHLIWGVILEKKHKNSKNVNSDRSSFKYCSELVVSFQPTDKSCRFHIRSKCADKTRATAFSPNLKMANF